MIAVIGKYEEYFRTIYKTCCFLLVNIFCRLSHCNLTGACCGDLASLFISSQSLTDLDLRYIEMGGQEARLLREGLEHPNCKLQNLL